VGKVNREGRVRAEPALWRRMFAWTLGFSYMSCCVSFSRVSPFSGVSGVLRFIHTQWQYTHTRIYVMVLWFIGRKAIPSFPPREVLQDYIRGRLAKAGTKQIQKERARERESDRATESVCV